MFKDDPEGGPAFPTIELRTTDTHDIVQPARQGMSLRDYIAVHVKVSRREVCDLLLDPSQPWKHLSDEAACEGEAKLRYMKADAMLKVRGQDNG